VHVEVVKKGTETTSVALTNTNTTNITLSSTINTNIINTTTTTKKGKVIPLQAQCGPEGR